MLPNEFFYWLQGYFEISGTNSPLTTEQAKCINRHIELVVTWASGGPRHDRIAVPERVIEIRTLLSLISSADADVITAEVRKRVSDQFVHVIDPQAGDESIQNALNHTRGHKPGQPLMRC